jgi:hypothetical protein
MGLHPRSQSSAADLPLWIFEGLVIEDGYSVHHFPEVATPSNPFIKVIPGSVKSLGSPFDQTLFLMTNTYIILHFVPNMSKRIVEAN